MATDNGRKYLHKEFEEFLKKNGIQRRLSITYNLNKTERPKGKIELFWKWLAVCSSSRVSRRRFELKPFQRLIISGTDVQPRPSRVELHSSCGPGVRQT